MSQKTAEKSPENQILAKGNSSCKSRSSVTKVELDVYYAKANSCTKFQSISQKTAEKSPENLTQRAITHVKVSQV